MTQTLATPVGLQGLARAQAALAGNAVASSAAAHCAAFLAGQPCTEASHVVTELHDARTYWFHGTVPHREDGPAIVGPGSEEWYRYGALHRLDGPAHTDSESSEWWANGKRHREDGPAVLYPDGGQEWWLRHSMHRGDGPAFSLPGQRAAWMWNNFELTEDDVEVCETLLAAGEKDLLTRASQIWAPDTDLPALVDALRAVNQSQR